MDELKETCKSRFFVIKNSLFPIKLRATPQHFFIHWFLPRNFANKSNGRRSIDKCHEADIPKQRSFSELVKLTNCSTTLHTTKIHEIFESGRIKRIRADSWKAQSFQKLLSVLAICWSSLERASLSLYFFSHQKNSTSKASWKSAKANSQST